MNIEQFMQGYKAAWEGRDERLFCVLFAEDGAYHNTPFAVQRGHAQLDLHAALGQRRRIVGDAPFLHRTHRAFEHLGIQREADRLDLAALALAGCEHLDECIGCRGYSYAVGVNQGKDPYAALRGECLQCSKES